MTSDYSIPEIIQLYPMDGGPTTFKFSVERKLRIEGCATKEDLANTTEFDSEGQSCLIFCKDGNATELTVGCYAGLVSFILNEVGIEPVELGIYKKSSPPRETRAPSSGTRRKVVQLTPLANSTLDVAEAAPPVTMLRIEY
ncbi:hypothetical protein H0H81_008377 [Sphagnurus paluster]|uniref:Uncharacterized protein n=1 Tax=Sphagnurus paluster TaxID=117069 RepID=A0A9P7GIZ0_9AGAR|nr:hypothetical protein H0H81_008377 [Sphagnurus paluster]